MPKEDCGAEQTGGAGNAAREMTEITVTESDEEEGKEHTLPKEAATATHVPPRPPIIRGCQTPDVYHFLGNRTNALYPARTTNGPAFPLTIGSSSHPYPASLPSCST